LQKATTQKQDYVDFNSHHFMLNIQKTILLSLHKDKL